MVNIVDKDKDINLFYNRGLPEMRHKLSRDKPEILLLQQYWRGLPRLQGPWVRRSRRRLDRHIPSAIPCRSCNGLRLGKEALSVKFKDLNIGEFCRMSVTDTLFFLDTIKLTERENIIASRILREIQGQTLFSVPGRTGVSHSGQTVTDALRR